MRRFRSGLRYEPYDCWDVQTGSWGGYGATGSYSCLEVGRLLWPPSGCTRQRLGRWWIWALFLLCMRGCRCVRQGLGADLAAASWVGPTGVRRWAWLVLVGSWPVHVVRTMCSAKACCEAVSDPICVLALLLCRLQVCRCYNDERGSLGCVWAGCDERGDVFLGVCCVRRPRFLAGGRC